jgi:hypothetical protein
MQSEALTVVQQHDDCDGHAVPCATTLSKLHAARDTSHDLSDPRRNTCRNF